jgi:hypothetical protein
MQDKSIFFHLQDIISSHFQVAAGTAGEIDEIGEKIKGLNYGKSKFSSISPFSLMCSYLGETGCCEARLPNGG